MDELSVVQKKIILCREKLGLSQSELARRVGVSRTTVYQWAIGRNKPEEETMVKVAEVLGTSISYLYGETDDPRPAREWHTAPSSAQQTALATLHEQLVQLATQVAEMMTVGLPIQEEITSEVLASISDAEDAGTFAAKRPQKIIIIKIASFSAGLLSETSPDPSIPS